MEKTIIRLYGIGEKVQQLNQELSKCIDNNYGLNFKYPTEKEKQQIDTIVKKNKKLLSKLLKLLIFSKQSKRMIKM